MEEWTREQYVEQLQQECGCFFPGMDLAIAVLLIQAEIARV